MVRNKIILSNTFQSQGAANRKISMNQPTEERSHDKASKNAYKRVKIDESEETVNNNAQLAHKNDEFCEKENDAFKSVIKPRSFNERVILKDNNILPNNKVTEAQNDAEATERFESMSNKFSKRSGPLSPIDSISFCKPSNIKQCPDENVFKKQMYNDQSLLLSNEVSAELQLFSEHSNNDLASHINEAQSCMKSMKETPCPSESAVSSTLQKGCRRKQKKRIDPAHEKLKQNYGYYQHF